MKEDYKEGDWVEWEAAAAGKKKTHQGQIVKRLEPGEQTTLDEFCARHQAKAAYRHEKTPFYREPSFVVLRTLDPSETRWTAITPHILQHRPASRIRPFSGGLPAMTELKHSTPIVPPPMMRESVASLGLDGLNSLKAGKEFLRELNGPEAKPEGHFAEIAATTLLDTRGEPEVRMERESKEVFDRSEYLFRLSKALELGAKTAVAATFDEVGLVVIWAPRRALKRMQEVSGLFSDPSGSYKIILFRPMGFWMTINEWEHSKIRPGTAKDLAELGILISKP